jgi:hypothetical protein
MNVKEDYGELSSIARSVHVIYTVSRPTISMLYLEILLGLYLVCQSECF